MYEASGTRLVGIADGNGGVAGAGCPVTGLPVVVVGDGDWCTLIP